MGVKCAKCKRKIFRYLVIGKGELWHCRKDRIIEDYGVRDGNEIGGVEEVISEKGGKWDQAQLFDFLA